MKDNGRNIGLRDVARVAGVSTATVSRAMNNPAAVSEELRDRIASVVRHLGWVPHGAARALATRRTGTIGAVFPTLTHGDFARAIQALQSELSEAGYTLLLACSEYDAEQEYRQVRKLIERGVDALLLVGEAHHRDLAELLDKNRIPYVNTFVYNPTTHGTCVGPDNHKALHKLTRYLIGLGHRSFGVVAQSTDNNDRAQARLQGIRDALAEKSIAIQPRHFAQGYWGINEGRQLFRRMLAHRTVADRGDLRQCLSDGRCALGKPGDGHRGAGRDVDRRLRRHRDHVGAADPAHHRAGVERRGRPPRRAVAGGEDRGAADRPELRMRRRRDRARLVGAGAGAVSVAPNVPRHLSPLAGRGRLASGASKAGEGDSR
jgi:DNA-binding LacI/PurR family transcriptional regulator